jgi:fucose permease
VVIERYREKSARPLAILHAAATLGAVLSPPIIGWLTAASGDWTTAFRAGGASFGLLAVWVAFVPLPRPGEAGPHGDGHGPPASARNWLPAVAGLCLVGFAYVGVENGVTVFAVPYATAVADLAERVGQESISTFWLGLLLARLGLALHPGTPGPGWLVAMGVSGAATLLLGVATGWPEPRVWTFGVGVCLGGVFPLMVTLAGLLVPHAIGTATAVVIGTASLGGFAVPWFAGALGDRSGAAASMAALAVVSIAVAVGGAVTRRIPRPLGSPASTD